MTYAVKIMGPARAFFLRDTRNIKFEPEGISCPDIREFSTREEAEKAGKNSLCVQATGWRFQVVDAEEAKTVEFIEDHLSHV